MAKFDKNIDVRDRSRFFRKIFDMEIIDLKKLLFVDTLACGSEINVEKKTYVFGTLSCYRACKLKGYHPLPQFPLKNIATYRGQTVISTIIMKRVAKSYQKALANIQELRQLPTQP